MSDQPNEIIQKTIVITGANGFIGSRLCELFANQGWKVYAGVRSPNYYRESNKPNIHPFQWNVPKAMNWPDHKIDVCVHLAYEMKSSSRAKYSATNVRGTKKAYQFAKNLGCDYQVFVSSCSAHSKALSNYGKSKFHLEKKIDIKRHLVIKPGFVVGPGGLFQRMIQTVNKAPFIPLFDGGNQLVQIIDVDDLCHIIFNMISKRHKGIEVIAHPKSMRMKNFQELMLRREKPSLSIPSKPVLIITQALELLGISLPVTSENLLGLRGMVEHKVTNLVAWKKNIIEPEEAIELALEKLQSKK